MLIEVQRTLNVFRRSFWKPPRALGYTIGLIRITRHGMLVVERHPMRGGGMRLAMPARGSLRRTPRFYGRPGFVRQKRVVSFGACRHRTRFALGILFLVHSFFSGSPFIGTTRAANVETARLVNLCFRRRLIDIPYFTSAIISLFLEGIPASLWLFGRLLLLGGELREGYFHR